MANLRKIVSFIYPITKKISTSYNGVVEVTYINGRKVLDSEKTNYSFGSLQRVLEFALRKAYHSGIQSVLLLGLGGGSVVVSLRERFRHKGSITAVELDPDLIRIANDEFGIKEDEQLRIINQDAVPFILQDNSLYDLIIVDLFIDDTIPPAVLNPNFWRGIVRHVANKGTVIFNSLSQETHAASVSGFLSAEGCDLNVFDNVEGMNSLLIARIG